MFCYAQCNNGALLYELFCCILTDIDSLREYCSQHPESRLDNGREFGFRADTGNYAYLMRLNPNKNELNVQCCCYRRDWLDRHLRNAENGIRFIDPNYNEKFRLGDGDKIKIHYAWGEDEIKTCRYIDVYHLEVGSNLYHIAEFAEKMAAGGHSCEPLEAEEGLNKVRGIINTNMGVMPVEDYREIKAMQSGFDSYEDMYKQGFRLHEQPEEGSCQSMGM